jgi:hypothetical protein
MANHVVWSTQATFMQGRKIFDGVVILHEMVHELHPQKTKWGDIVSSRYTENEARAQ